MRRIRTIAVLPTLFTLSNLVCGFFAIVVATRIEAPKSEAVATASVPEIHLRAPVTMMRQLDPHDPIHNALLAGWLIFLAMLFDALDGGVARLARVTSDFGAQLDSLCDVVTFGVAPAILMVKMCPTVSYLHREGIWIIAASFAACAALRLARFNVESDDAEDHLHFSGLPSPAAAATVAACAILFYTLRKDGSPFVDATEIYHWLQRLLPCLTLVIAVLMVSRVPYPHLVTQLLRGNRSFGHVVGLVFTGVAVGLFWGYAVPLLCAAYATVPPIRFAAMQLLHRRSEKEPLF